jgi:hypothetical protein
MPGSLCSWASIGLPSKGPKLYSQLSTISEPTVRSVNQRLHAVSNPVLFEFTLLGRPPTFIYFTRFDNNTYARDPGTILTPINLWA